MVKTIAPLALLLCCCAPEPAPEVIVESNPEVVMKDGSISYRFADLNGVDGQVRIYITLEPLSARANGVLGTDPTTYLSTGEVLVRELTLEETDEAPHNELPVWRLSLMVELPEVNGFATLDGQLLAQPERLVDNEGYIVYYRYEGLITVKVLGEEATCDAGQPCGEGADGTMSSTWTASLPDYTTPTPTAH